MVLSHGEIEASIQSADYSFRRVSFHLNPCADDFLTGLCVTDFSFDDLTFGLQSQQTADKQRPTSFHKPLYLVLNFAAKVRWACYAGITQE